MKISGVKRFLLLTLRILVVFVPGWLITACTNDIETIKAITGESKMPDVTGYQIELAYTDSGTLKGKIYAPEVLQYNHVEEPYDEFPKGMRAVFFNAEGKEVSSIQAKYAIHYHKKQLWEGRNRVIGENRETGEKIETEQLFWDQIEKRVYSDKYTRITRNDGVFIGENGFESNENLSDYSLNGYSGKVTLTDIPAEDNENP